MQLFWSFQEVPSRCACNRNALAKIQFSWLLTNEDYLMLKMQTICELINKTDYRASHESYQPSISNNALSFSFGISLAESFSGTFIHFDEAEYLLVIIWHFTVSIRHREQTKLRLPLAARCWLNSPVVGIWSLEIYQTSNRRYPFSPA